MSGILDGVETGVAVLGEVVKETPAVESLLADVINFLHIHFPGFAGLPAKPVPTDPGVGK